MSLTAAQLEAADDLPREQIPVPEWGGPVSLRVLTAGEHAHFGVIYPDVPKDDVVCHVLAMCLCDDAGAPLFPDPAAGVRVLKGKNKDVVKRLFEAASRLNRLDEGDEEAIAKNSGTSPSDDSSSEWPPAAS